MISKHLFVILAYLFVVVIGPGITLPVVPFYLERIALEAGAAQQSIVLHVALLTGVYSLMPLVCAPLWGRWSDRIGRRPLILIGIAGYVVVQVMFGLSTSLWLLYMARIVRGILSSATLPVSAAYVADMTTQDERSRGMAWLGTAASLGVAVGPARGGLLLALTRAVLFIRQINAPYLLSSVRLLALAPAIGWNVVADPDAPPHRFGPAAHPPYERCVPVE